MKAAAGDKVRVKIGSHASARGLVESLDGEKLLVLLDGSGVKVRLLPEEVSNYSLAARKAWVTGPDRAVGRRKGTRLCDRVSVTLRIDRDMWEQFRALEESGTIEDRTAIINGWFREKLSKLTEGGSGDAEESHK